MATAKPVSTTPAESDRPAMLRGRVVFAELPVDAGVSDAGPPGAGHGGPRCAFLHDLARALHYHRPGLVDCSAEVIAATERIFYAHGDGSYRHVAGALLIATKLVSVQYCESARPPGGTRGSEPDVRVLEPDVRFIAWTCGPRNDSQCHLCANCTPFAQSPCHARWWRGSLAATRRTCARRSWSCAPGAGGT